MTGQNYLQMLQEDFFSAHLQYFCNENDFFMQDGAPSHYANTVNTNFAGIWIGRRRAVELPARSPDLTPLNFFWWDYLMQIVYGQKPESLNELKEIIQRCCAEIPLEMLKKACRNVKSRCEMCLQNKGAQFEYLKT